MNDRIVELMSESLGLILVGRYHDAFTKLNHLLVLDPESNFAKTLLFKTAVQTMNNEIVLSTTEELLESDPDNVEYLFQRANSLGVLNKLDSALEVFNKVIDIEPAFYLAYCCRGRVLREMNSHELALKDFNVAVENIKDDPLVYAQRGLTFLEMENFENALPDLSEALRIDKKNEIIRLHLAVALRGLGKYKQSLSVIRKAINISFYDSDCYYQRGLIYQKNNLYNKAIKDFNKSVEMDSRHEHAYYYRALLLIHNHEYEKALADLERVLQLDCDYFKYDVFIGFATVFCKMKQFDKAIDFANRALALNADNMNVFVMFAEIYGELGETEKFYENLELAVKAGYDWKTMDKTIRKKYFKTQEFKQFIKNYIISK